MILRSSIAALILVASPLVLSHDVVDPDHVILATASDLRDWCQRESEARLIGEGHTPANWTARHYEKLNTLVVEGNWRIDGKTVDVACRAARGARDEFATVELRPR